MALILSSNTWSEKTNERGRAASSAFRSSHVSEEGSRKRRTRSWHTHQDGAQVRHVAEEAEDVHGGRIRAQTTRCEFRSGVVDASTWACRDVSSAREKQCEERGKRPVGPKTPGARRISHLEPRPDAVRDESRTLKIPRFRFCHTAPAAGVRRSSERTRVPRSHASQSWSRKQPSWRS